MKIFRYGVTDSTNTRAREYAEGADVKMPAVFIANGQTDGRGRRGRSFDSAAGAGLYVSYLFRPTGELSDPAKITVRAAVALARALSRTAGLKCEIKWVNDILVGGRKLAGILAEGALSQDGTLEYAVCGIGVNLRKRDFPAELSGIVTTVEDETGRAIDAEQLAAALTEELFSEEDFSETLREYRRMSAVIGKRVEVRRISGEVFFAGVINITDSAALLVELADGSREELTSAEVSIK